jgi:hypothetical protein
MRCVAVLFAIALLGCSPGNPLPSVASEPPQLGEGAAQSGSTKSYLWKQCTEPVLVLRVDPAPFAEIVGRG